MTIALPRGSTTGFQSAFDPDKGTALYRHPNFLTDIKTWSDISNEMIPNGGPSEGRHVGLRVAVGNLSADNVTASVRILLVYRIRVNVGDETPVDYYILREYATLAVVAGQMTIGSASKLMADTIVATLGAWGTFLEARDNARDATALTVATVPQGMALYDIPDVDNCDGVIFDLNMTGGGASSSANVFSCWTT